MRRLIIVVLALVVISAYGGIVREAAGQAMFPAGLSERSAYTDRLLRKERIELDKNTLVCKSADVRYDLLNMEDGSEEYKTEKALYLKAELCYEIKRGYYQLSKIIGIDPEALHNREYCLIEAHVYGDVGSGALNVQELDKVYLPVWVTSRVFYNACQHFSN